MVYILHFLNRNIMNVMSGCHYGKSFEPLPGRVAACFALKTNGENRTRCLAHAGAIVPWSRNMRDHISVQGCWALCGRLQFAGGIRSTDLGVILSAKLADYLQLHNQSTVHSSSRNCHIFEVFVA